MSRLQEQQEHRNKNGLNIKLRANMGEAPTHDWTEEEIGITMTEASTLSITSDRYIHTHTRERNNASHEKYYHTRNRGGRGFRQLAASPNSRTRLVLNSEGRITLRESLQRGSVVVKKKPKRSRLLASRTEFTRTLKCVT